MPTIQKTFIFIVLLFTLLFTACNDDNKEAQKPKRVLLEGNASEENHYEAQKHFLDGEYAKALEFHLKQLAEDLKYFKEESLEIASDYNSIALDYDELENHEKALEYYLKTLKIDESVLEDNTTERSTTFYNVASSYDALEQYANAIKYYAKALAIDEVLLGAYHSDLLAEYEGLAIAYEKTSKFHLSQRYWKKALHFKEHVYGKANLDSNETRKKLEEIQERLVKKIN